MVSCFIEFASYLLFIYGIEFIEGDEFCVNCRIILCVDDEGDDLEDEIIEGPGKYCVLWHR